MQRWYERYPSRLDEELSALTSAGYEYQIDADERAQGRIVLRVQYPLGKDAHELTVYFPDSYPYFPFDIVSATFPGGRHKDPYSGLLCLLKDPTQNWRTDDTLASILKTQIAAIVEAHERPETAEDLEAHEGAQITGQFGYLPGTIVFIGDWEIPEDHVYGQLRIGRLPSINKNAPLRGAVLAVQDAKGNAIASLDDSLVRRFPNGFKARWGRLPAPPSSIDGEEVLREAMERWPEIKKPKFDGGPDVVGLIFPEEVSYREYRENWVFVVRTKERAGSGKVEIKGYIARAELVSRKAIEARIPRLLSLADKRVLIIGLGAIGSSCAWQLARSGIGGLTLLDFDHVQLGNSPRWLLGWGAVGHHKALVLGDYLVNQYPYTDIRMIGHRIGNPCFGPDRRLDNEVLSTALADVDLILDATAEWSVNHYLSDLARQLGIPYVWATGTPGSWGGVVGRVIPGQTEGCWKCYQRHLGEQTFEMPAQEEVPDVQPVGCFHPTFPGSGFDMEHISLAVVRLAVATLCSSAEGGYPDFDWDVGVVNLWDEEAGTPIAPHWSTYKLHRHAQCEEHG